MNPFPMVMAMFRHNRLPLAFFVVLMAFSVALGVAVTSQERAFRQGSARAADKFDLLVGAPGSQFDLVLSAVYLRVSSMELLSPEVLAELLEEEQADWVAPMAFGDSHAGYQIIGTTQDLVSHLSPEWAEGRGFEEEAEAVIGANVSMGIGEGFRAAHGGPGFEDHMHVHDLTVVGRMQSTHTPWDDAIIVPVEHSWESHDLPNGHAPEADEDHDHGTGHEDDHADGDHEHDEHEEADHDHEHEHAEIGPPFDPDYLPGVPAVIVKPSNVAAAYGLRQKYRTERSQALFPAEILVQLYALMGDARGIMNLIALATQILVVAAILSGLMVVLQLYAKKLAILRALGATRSYVILVAWTYLTALVAVGSVAGIGLGYAAARIVSAALTQATGFDIVATLTFEELGLVLGLLGLAALLAVVPALILFNRPISDALRA